MSQLVLRDLNVSYGKHEVLKHIDLAIEPREFVSLLGPSGCGKTTLLKAVAGLIEVGRGSEVLIDSEAQGNRAPEKRNTVIVFQDLRLFPHMDVLDNIAYGLKVRGVSRKQRRNDATELLKKVGLDGMGERKTASLSGGQQQRVALARALATHPRLLLLDEAFSSLDSNIRQRMRELVLHLHHEFGLTTMLVTHDYQEAMLMSDRLAVILDGRIAQFDTPSRVFEHPANQQVADFFGEMNYLEGRVEGGHFVDKNGAVSVVSALSDIADGEYQMMFNLYRRRSDE